MDKCSAHSRAVRSSFLGVQARRMPICSEKKLEKQCRCLDHTAER